MATAILARYGGGPTLAIAIRLLDHCNLKTLRCDPSFAKLAEDAHVGRSTALRAVQRLEADGWLTVTRRKSPNPERQKQNLTSAYAWNWHLAPVPAAETDTGVVSPVEHGGVTSDTTLVSPAEHPSVTSDTRNLESKTKNQNYNAKLAEEASIDEDEQALQALVSDMDSDCAESELVRRANDDRAAETRIGQVFCAWGGYSPESGFKIGEHFADAWFAEHVPPAAWRAMVRRCRAGKLTRNTVERVAVAINAPRAK